MFARAFRTLILISFTLAAAAPNAQAEEGKKPDFAAAKKAFKAGQAFIQMEKYAEAVVEFKKAHEITKDDLVMGQVAMAYAKGGDYEAALAAIKVYRAALPEGERGSADDLIKQYQAKIKAGESKKLVLSTDKPAETDETKGEETSGETATETDEEEGGRKGRFYTWIAAGAAGALALSALIVGLDAQSKYDELDGLCAPGCDPADVDSVKTRAVVTDVLWGTAAVAAVAAGVLYWLEGRNLSSDEEEKRGPVEGEDEDSDDDLVKRFRIAPLVGGGTYGLGADIRF